MSLWESIKLLEENLGNYRDALSFNVETALEIRHNTKHEKHTEYFNERYWHGFAVGLQYAQEMFSDRFRVSTKRRDDKNE